VSFERMEQTILATAGELFDRQGFNQTSLQDIAEALGMARPSLYHYFANREQILSAGVDRLTEHRDALTAELRRLEGDPVERLRASLLGLGAVLSENPVWVRVLLRDSVALPSDVRDRDRASRLRYFDLLVGTLRDGIDGGYLRPVDERAVALTLLASLTGLQGQYEAAADANVPQSDAVQLTVEIAMHGILVGERRAGTPLERGLQLIREGTALIERASAHEGS
jgi:AcrR family transcriptional regulator